MAPLRDRLSTLSSRLRSRSRSGALPMKQPGSAEPPQIAQTPLPPTPGAASSGLQNSGMMTCYCKIIWLKPEASINILTSSHNQATKETFKVKTPKEEQILICENRFAIRELWLQNHEWSVGVSLGPRVSDAWKRKRRSSEGLQKGFLSGVKAIE